MELDVDICPYLTMLMVAMLAWVSEALVMPKSVQRMIMNREAFDNILLKEAGHDCDNYELVSR